MEIKNNNKKSNIEELNKISDFLLGCIFGEINAYQDYPCQIPVFKLPFSLLVTQNRGPSI